jgi:hypothetical protein
MYKEFVACATCAALGSVEFHHQHNACEREAETLACVRDYGLQPHVEHELSAEQIVEPVVAVHSVGSMPFNTPIFAMPQQPPEGQQPFFSGSPTVLLQQVTDVSSGAVS